MTLNRATLLGAVVTAVLFCISTTMGNIVSTFDTDDEGWLIFGDAQGASVTPTYRSTGGNPGGHIEATDNVTGGTWYFSAPAKFLGNQLAAYGNTLSFDLKQSSLSSQFNNSDIVLVGGGMTIVFDTPNNPGLDWTSYSVTIDDAAGWKLNTLAGANATQGDIQTVLGNLTALRIRGEFVTGPDTGSLDNVVLVPEPANLAVVSLGALVLRRRRWSD